MATNKIRVTTEMIEAGNAEMKRLLAYHMTTLGPASPRTLEAVYKAMRCLEPSAEHAEDCTCGNCDPGRLGFKLY